MKQRIGAFVLFILGLLVAYFVYFTQSPDSRFPFRFGLDLESGIHLTYKADTSKLASGDIGSSMDSLRQTIERRINIFGVSEPIIQIEKGGIFSTNDSENRLIVELPGITDLNAAVEMIGKTPLLEFKLATQDQGVIDKISALDPETASKEELDNLYSQLYIPTGLTGGLLKRADLQFVPPANEPVVGITFNSEGRDLFAKITEQNVGQVLAIFLDGQPISQPVIRDKILNGQAQISGNFKPEEARQLVRDLNFGALPVPIELIETQTIGASLGQGILNDGVKALAFGFIIVFIFMVIWYRLPGLLASISLFFYLVIMLALFKLIPVTLTASGIAGLILSIGMAVDANVLIFERMREEIKGGAKIAEAIIVGSKRAWTSIRDGNITSLISAVILYWLSGTSVVKGFALVFGIGILVSMFTAIVVTRSFALALSPNKINRFFKFLFGSGVRLFKAKI